MPDIKPASHSEACTLSITWAIAFQKGQEIVNVEKLFSGLMTKLPERITSKYVTYVSVTLDLKYPRK